MKALVTGITGQDGGYLAKLLLEKNYEVHGLVSRRVNQSYVNLEWLDIKDKIKYHFADLTDSASVNHVVSEVQPDELYNLGAQSFVGLSWETPTYTSNVNAMGALHILEAVRQHSPHTKVYQASTSEMYGNCGGSDAKNELTPFIPRSPYGVAKVFAHNMMVNYRESYDIFTTCGILFNHESPCRGLEFVTRKITDAVAQISMGKASYVTLGNLDAQRDWGFAGDYVEGMWLMMQQDVPSDYVLATGMTWSIKDFLQQAFAYKGMDYKHYVRTDPKFVRPAELDVLLGDPTKAKTDLGWEPKTKLNELVKMMVDADVQRHSST